MRIKTPEESLTGDAKKLYKDILAQNEKQALVVQKQAVEKVSLGESFRTSCLFTIFPPPSQDLR